ncbi:angiomotin-like [Nylanderia fulva]|uniref:angiomotin-like n=1 Tax=Nylanderia fulva TaxID=613905 RepID=UPI0010FB30AB|nr:angiomotin-like [Nylanderia fulva]
MQQGSVGGCDEDSGATSPPARSPSGFAIKSEPADRNDVRIKVEMPEPTEDYQRQPGNENYRYGEKKPGYVPDLLGTQCQPPGYRPVGLPNSFGFPPFYGHHHPAMMPFPAGRPSPDGPIGKIADGHEQQQPVSSHPYGRMPPIPNDGFLQEHHHRSFDAGDFQHAGMPYPGFRPTMRSSYGNHHHHHHHHHHHQQQQNNSAYNRSHYHPARQRKWSSTAFRGLHPPMPILYLETIQH